MGIWFFVGVAIAVGIGVYFGLKFYNDAEGTWNDIKIWGMILGLGALALGIVGGVIFLIYLGIKHIIS